MLSVWRGGPAPSCNTFFRLRIVRLLTFDAGDGARAGVLEEERVVDAWALLGEPHRGSLRELIAAGRIEALRGRSGSWLLGGCDGSSGGVSGIWGRISIRCRR